MTAKPKPKKPTSPRGLARGTEWRGDGISVKVLDYRQNSGGYGAQPGQRWDAVLARSCILPTRLTKKGVTLSWNPWSLVDRQGGLYPASSSTYNGFPLPEYPFAGDSAFMPGDCVTGWIVFNVPDNAKPTGVRYGNNVGDTATWRLT